MLTKEDADIYRQRYIDETLPYQSPELTGRMNRSIDYRTDIYSLGIIMYQMLTGIVPFKSSDPLKLIHSHIAQRPIAPESLNTDIPKILSDIIFV